MAHAFGELLYTLSALILADYNKTTDTYGTPLSISDGQMLVFEPEHDTDKLRGFGAYSAGLSVPIGNKITFKAGGIERAILQKISPAVVSTSGTSGTRISRTRVPAGGRGMGYFGVIGVASNDDGGLTVVGAKICMLDKLPTITLDGETNKFTLYETSGYAFCYNGAQAVYMETHEATSTWSAPDTAAEFKTWFTTIEAIS